jgi:hypothetical protein
MVQITVSYPPPGKFDINCPELVISLDTFGTKNKRVIHIPTDRVPDFVAGQGDLGNITTWTIRTSGPARRSRKKRQGNGNHERPAAGPKKSASRVRCPR